MSKEDTVSGLLSKLVKFVRNPATNWTELDSVNPDKDDSVNKQLLKEMIERKRRNDFVRKREFDMLRKLRKLEALAETVQDGGKPSFFNSSMASRPDDRASTLKKIDEIEAQMSMQWWKGKAQPAPHIGHKPSLLQSPDDDTLNPGAQSSLMQLPIAYQTTMPAVRDTLAPSIPAAPEHLVDGLLEDLPQGPGKKDPLTSSSTGWDSAALELSSSLAPSPAAVQQVILHDAELEEAAILFANGDDAGAEAGLLDILSSDALRAEPVQAWLALFDLHRATGNQEKFEVAALEFASRFDRSAPQWFSMPDMVKSLTKPMDIESAGKGADWICPSALGMQSVASLNSVLSRAAMPWRLDWRNLKSIDVSALDPLHKLLATWGGQNVQLRFMGDEQLQKVLLNATPSGDRTVDQRWWLLRMEMLRILHRPDDFELTALDFCVTFEVSPPAWTSAACTCKLLDLDGGAMGSATIIGEPSSDPLTSRFSLTAMEAYMDSDAGYPSSGLTSQFLSVELSGQIQGHAAEVLDRLEASLCGADRMQINCAQLIRVDFSAAGMLLNWVSARQAENRFVEFSEVNRLVAAFFNVIGITEYAKVVVRTD